MDAAAEEQGRDQEAHRRTDRFDPRVDRSGREVIFFGNLNGAVSSEAAPFFFTERARPGRSNVQRSMGWRIEDALSQSIAAPGDGRAPLRRRRNRVTLRLPQ